MCDFDVWTYVARMGVRLRASSDPFFLDGDSICSMRHCSYLIQEDEEEFLHTDFKEFPCSVPGCQSGMFKQLHEFETHYNTLHRHVCATCNKTLPSAYLLELHITETHDSFFAVMSKKKSSYECFLERCSRKFWSHEERRDHCIKTHQFPADFKFDEARTDKPSRSSPPEDQASNQNVTDSHDMEIEEEEDENVVVRMREGLEQPSSSASRSSSLSVSANSSPRKTPSSSISSPRKGSSASSVSSSGVATATSSPRARVTPRPRSSRGSGGSNASRVRPHSVLITASEVNRVTGSRIPSPVKDGNKRSSLRGNAPGCRASPSPSSNLSGARSSAPSAPSPSCNKNAAATAPATASVPPTTASNGRRFSLKSIVGVRATKSESPPPPRKSLNVDDEVDSDVIFRKFRGRRLLSTDHQNSRESPDRDSLTKNRTPFSLARMGQRLSSSRSSLSSNSSPEGPPPPTGPLSSKPSAAADIAPSTPSRIPLLRSSVSFKERASSLQVPKVISFGSGVPKAFESKSGGTHWHSSNSSARNQEEKARGGRRGNVIEDNFEVEMKDALPL